MKAIAVVLVIVFLGACAAFAAEQPKVSIEAKNTPVKDFVSQLAQQSGASIVLDPKVQASVSISLKDVDLSQALDAVTKLNKLVWKKLQFAKPSDETVKLDQIKSAMLALASMPMMGLSVEDPASKTTAVFAKDLPSSPDTSGMKLPEGYSWMTVYVILASEPKETKPAATTALSADNKERLLQMAKMTPEERQQAFAQEMAAQMSLAPEVRRAIMADRMKAMSSMDPQYRDQYREDMHSVFHDLRAENPNMGRIHGGPGAQGEGQGRHGHRDRGNNPN